MIYLDNNASTRPAPEVSELICRALDGFYGNPSSSHLYGRQAKAMIDSARESVAALTGAEEPGEIYFTSGATESNNIAIFGAAAMAAGSSGGPGHIISQQTEHPAILNPLKVLQDQGFEITLLPVDGNGVVCLEELGMAIRPNTVLVTIMHANNETGVIQPIPDAVKICRAKNEKTLFHTDAAQSVGKIPVDARFLGVDMLSIAAHKFYGPKGIGALYVKKGIPLKNVLMFGAGHEKGMRPGTENTPYIAGLGKACELAKKELAQRMERLKSLRDMLCDLLAGALPGLKIKINGGGADRLPNTLNISIPGADGSLLVEALKDSVAISAGSACHAGRRSPSSVLKAMGASDDEAFSSVRITVGRDNTEKEIREAAAILQKAVLQLAQAR